MSLKSRDSYLRKTYGISLAQYDELLWKQKGVCWICRTPPPKGKNLHVDHDHKSGEIRGLLCFRCNHLLVGRYNRSDRSLLLRLVRYLNQGTGFIAPPKPKRKRRRKRK